MSINALEAARRSADEDRLVQELHKVRSLRSSRRARERQVIEILRHTGSSKVRNAAALALADMRATDAAKELIQLLSSADTTGSRGTLLYALDELGGLVPLQTLTEIVLGEGYEAMAEALNLIDKNRSLYPDSQRRKAVRKLRAAQKALDAERSNAAKLAIEYLQHAP
jgi:hypothetical protein